MKIVLLLFCMLISSSQSYAASDGGGDGRAVETGPDYALEDELKKPARPGRTGLRKNRLVGQATVVALENGFFGCSLDGCGYKDTIAARVRKHCKTHSETPEWSCQIPGCNYLNKSRTEPERWASANSVTTHYLTYHGLTKKEAGALPKKPGQSMTGLNQKIANEVLSRLAAGKMLPTSTDAGGGGGGGGGSGAARDSDRRLEEEDEEDVVVTNDNDDGEAAPAGAGGGGSGWEECAAKEAEDAAAAVASLLETHADSPPTHAHRIEEEEDTAPKYKRLCTNCYKEAAKTYDTLTLIKKYRELHFRKAFNCENKHCPSHATAMPRGDYSEVPAPETTSKNNNKRRRAPADDDQKIPLCNDCYKQGCDDDEDGGQDPERGFISQHYYCVDDVKLCVQCQSMTKDQRRIMQTQYLSKRLK